MPLKAMHVDDWVKELEDMIGTYDIDEKTVMAVIRGML